MIRNNLFKNHRPILFTQEGFQKILNQKEELEKKRVEVLERLVRAREMGDLSENSAYHGAKLEMGSIDRQLRQIKIFLLFGKIISNINNSQVGIGSAVLVNDGTKNTELKIVGDYESDPINKKISANSPIGSALMGKKVNQECDVTLPDKKIKLKIVEIK